MNTKPEKKRLESASPSLWKWQQRPMVPEARGKACLVNGMS